MGPIDYLGAFPQEDFLRDIQGGLQIGQAYRQQQQQQAQQQLAQQQAQQYKTDVQSFYAQPSAKGALALQLKYPAQAKPISDAFGSYTADQQRTQLSDAVTLANLLHSGRADLAAQQVGDRITAAKNSDLPTADLEALQSVIQSDPQSAYAHALHVIGGMQGGTDVLKNIAALNEDDRKTAESDVKVAGEQSDNTLKGQQITAQNAGSLAKLPNLDYPRVATFVQSEVKAGRLPEGSLDSVPKDPSQLKDYLYSLMTSGIKPDDQQKYLAPTADTIANNDTSRANTAANNATQVRTTGMNNATQLQVQKMIGEREDAKDDSDAANFSSAAIDNAAARYNLDGTLPPMGMGKAASAGRTAILNRAAEMKAGIDPEQQRRDQLNNKATIANQNKAVSAFTSGKKGDAVRSFNVLLSHLDTLDGLSDALNNGNVQAINSLGNSIAKATGSAAPTNLEAVKHIVGDEAVKAIVGGAGALGDREAIAATIKSANSPAQLKGVIHNMKELAVGQLGGLEQQYQASTGLNDFEHLLSPAAKMMRAQHGGGRAPAATVGPAIGTVDGGFRFKGGDPSQPANWVPVR